MIKVIDPKLVWSTLWFHIAMLLRRLTFVEVPANEKVTRSIFNHGLN